MLFNNEIIMENFNTYNICVPRFMDATDEDSYFVPLSSFSIVRD